MKKNNKFKTSQSRNFGTVRSFNNSIMNYYSLNHKSPKTSFKNAVISGIAPDRGLYFPEKITPISGYFIENIEKFSNHEIAFEVINQFVGDEIPEKK